MADDPTADLELVNEMLLLLKFKFFLLSTYHKQKV